MTLELPKLSKELSLKGPQPSYNQEKVSRDISRRYQLFIELLPGAQSCSQK